MGRSPCCEAADLKRGPWTREEDQKLLAYIQKHGHGTWRSLPQKAGLQRCGKSCRLRWANYLRPDIKRGKFTTEEEQTIIQLHSLLGNRWSAIATHLPKRTDNEIKNYWNTRLKKRLDKMGIDPVTHKPRSPAPSSADRDSTNAAELSHVAQRESAGVEAEAVLVGTPKPQQHQHQLGSSAGSISATGQLLNKMATKVALPRCPDVIKTLQRILSKSTDDGCSSGTSNIFDIESPTTSTLSFLNAPPISTIPSSEFTELSGAGAGAGVCIGENVEALTTPCHDMVFDATDAWTMEPFDTGDGNSSQGFTNLHNFDDWNQSTGDGDSNSGGESDGFEESETYWNDISIW